MNSNHPKSAACCQSPCCHPNDLSSSDDYPYIIHHCPAQSACRYRLNYEAAQRGAANAVLPQFKLTIRQAQYLTLVTATDQNEILCPSGALRNSNRMKLLNHPEAQEALNDASFSQTLFSPRWNLKNQVTVQDPSNDPWYEQARVHEFRLKTHGLREQLMRSMTNDEAGELQYLAAAERETWMLQREHVCEELSKTPYPYHPEILPVDFTLNAKRHTIEPVDCSMREELLIDWLPSKNSAQRIMAYRLLGYGLKPLMVAWILGMVDEKCMKGGLKPATIASSKKTFRKRIFSDFISIGLRALRPASG